jgi:hypothetical protein
MSESMVSYVCLLVRRLAGHDTRIRVENNQVKFKFFTANHVLSLTLSQTMGFALEQKLIFQEEFDYYVKLIDVKYFNGLTVHWDHEVLHIQHNGLTFMLFVERALDLRTWHDKQNRKINKQRCQTRLRRRANRRMKKATKARKSRQSSLRRRANRRMKKSDQIKMSRQ